MSPEMLTLVAVVLAYDIALETWDLRSSIVEAEEVPRAICLRSLGLSLKDRSCTRLEKDMFGLYLYLSEDLKKAVVRVVQ